jgi:hypothetical protein
MPQLREWVVTGFSVIAFILLVKLLASYLPDMGFLGSAKQVLASI